MSLPPLVIFGPSGVGKGTLINRLMRDLPDSFGFSVSHTTRAPRPGERDGKEYHFTTPDNFKNLISDRAFIEHAQFSGNFYGTSFQAVKDVAATGKRCILDIDAQGVQQVKQTPLQPVIVFISPPSIAALSQRLRGRATDSEEAIQRRLATARREIEYARQPDIFDYVIINDDLDRAYHKFKNIANGEMDARGDQMPLLDDWDGDL
ncbi:guanylate kinase [Rhizopogon vinicolor AM-OR11-026]|uniref:Guanylate kinase n=1 Tax=Rhizopogon vinicolor AM-OR11-026 TaxID=1314800 RepID=A0A1B7MS61_9AGAM|nr:guanylate kinase [Rhizopogon vinicolor AM-OR11-026]